MTRSIVVGLDGTEQANAAAQWAAEEALLRGTGVLLVHAKEPVPEAVLPFTARESGEAWAEEMTARTAGALRERHPGLSVTTRLLPAGPVPGLVAAAEEGELLVLGSRALGSVAGYLLGSVGLTVAGAVARPVVLVRAGRTAIGLQGPVVVGTDVRQPVDAVLGFAFEEAARRRSPLRVVYAQQLPLYAGVGPAMVPDVLLAMAPEIRRSLDELLDPWRAKYPDVEADARVAAGSAGLELVDEAGEAALMVVGRRARHAVLGPHIGSVAHAVLHHSPVPVALVPHD
ncbi:stress-inducible protein [Streptomyces tanashiensis]|uniref:universal stress protein n=1 Tax=Streptomyces tanashiensis TaxID=67367 RepID=UPI00167C433A|nr:universal stress protein [Streptomyces tanashiensis]GGS89080.1 stress-inducible protein [Streptomyces tanashiensis]